MRPKLGEVYRHYKGGTYQIFGFAMHTETLEELVLYRTVPIDITKPIWARPLSMFMGTLPDGRKRFDQLV